MYRPTTAKLLSHAFIKQAKPKSYLIKQLLVDLPPLEERQTRRKGRMQYALFRAYWLRAFCRASQNGPNDEIGRLMGFLDRQICTISGWIFQPRLFQRL